MTEQRALTLGEAARQLRVTSQRVNQLLTSGTLTGPDTGPGRAPKHAPRVWESSLEREIARRATGGRGARRHLSDVTRGVSNSSGESSPAVREVAALEAALRMKIGLDSAREALRQERQVTRRLTRLLAAVTAELETAQTQADRLDSIAVGYSEALTQILTPDMPDSDV